MAIYYRQIDDLIIISGKTYPYKDIIKGFGGRFQGADKVWAVPASDDSLKEVKQLCKRVGGGPVKTNPPKPTPTLARNKEASATITDKVQIDGLSISELMTKVHLHIQQGFPRAEWVIGEIQSLSRRHTGTYLQLADFKEGSSKSATMTVNSTLWRSTQTALKGKLGDALDDILQEGMRIRALVQVGFYKDRGSISLNVLDLDPNFTKGALALAREAVLKELRSKGLDQLNKNLHGATFPFKIGLLSAEGSRAKSDFLDQLDQYGFPGEVLFQSAQMQGEKTIPSVLEGVQHLENEGCDYIVLTRGGGSQADLRWFDDIKIAMAIAQCEIPIISAIGHHDDVCVAEEVSHRREKTPTAAADFLISQFAIASERIERASQVIFQQANVRIHNEMELQIHLSKQINSLADRFLGHISEHLTFLSGQIQSLYHQAVSNIEARLQEFRKVLALNVQSFISSKEQAIATIQFGILEKFQSQINHRSKQLDSLEHSIKLSSHSFLGNIERNLDKIYTKIVALDPSPWLEKGWTQLTQNQKTIKLRSELKEDQPIFARLRDGRIKLGLLPEDQENKK